MARSILNLVCMAQGMAQLQGAREQALAWSCGPGHVCLAPTGAKHTCPGPQDHTAVHPRRASAILNTIGFYFVALGSAYYLTCPNVQKNTAFGDCIVQPGYKSATFTMNLGFCVFYSGVQYSTKFSQKSANFVAQNIIRRLDWGRTLLARPLLEPWKSQSRLKTDILCKICCTLF